MTSDFNPFFIPAVMLCSVLVHWASRFIDAGLDGGLREYVRLAFTLAAAFVLVLVFGQSFMTSVTPDTFVPANDCTPIERAYIAGFAMSIFGMFIESLGSLLADLLTETLLPLVLRFREKKPC